MILSQCWPTVQADCCTHVLVHFKYTSATCEWNMICRRLRRNIVSIENKSLPGSDKIGNYFSSYYYLQMFVILTFYSIYFSLFLSIHFWNYPSRGVLDSFFPGMTRLWLVWQAQFSTIYHHRPPTTTLSTKFMLERWHASAWLIDKYLGRVGKWPNLRQGRTSDNQLSNAIGRVNGRISDRTEILAPNFQLQYQYLLQLYSKNITIVHEHSAQEPCEWVDIDIGVLWVESKQKLHLKVGCPNFGPVRGLAIYPIYSDSTQRTPRSASTRDAEPWHFWSALAPAPAPGQHSGSGSGYGSGAAFRLRLRVKLFGSSGSGSGSGQNVPGLRLRLRWSSPHMSLNQQYDFQKCQMSKYDFILTWPWVWMLLWTSVFEICNSLSSKATGWYWRGHRLLRVALSEISGLGPKWSFATDTQHILNIRRPISPRWRFWSEAWPDLIKDFLDVQIIKMHVSGSE